MNQVMDAETRMALEEIKRDQKRILKALLGDPLDPEAPPGVLARLENHHETLFGCEQQKVKGLVEKQETTSAAVAVLQEGKTKFMAVCGVIGVVMSVLAWVIPLVVRSLLAH